MLKDGRWQCPVDQAVLLCLDCEQVGHQLLHAVEACASTTVQAPQPPSSIHNAAKNGNRTWNRLEIITPNALLSFPVLSSLVNAAF